MSVMKISVNKEDNMDTVFTPASVLSLLAQIEELADLEIGLTETLDGQLQLQVGESFYNIEPEGETEVQVSEQALDAVEDANEETYHGMEENGLLESNGEEAVESGLIKEAAKAMLLGGMIKLIPGLVSNK